MQTINQWLLTVLINALWQAVVITLLALLCDRLMRSAPAWQRHLLWVGTLILAVMLPLLSALDFVADDGRNAVAQGMVSIQVEAERSVSTLSSSALTNLFQQRPRIFSSEPLLTLLVPVCYLLSLLFHGAGLWRAWRKTKALSANSYAVELSHRIAEVKGRCQRAFGLNDVSLLCSAEVACPVAVGSRSIILPASLFNSAGPELLIAAIGHEAAHLKRRDFTLNLIYETLSVPFAFHPAIILIKRRIKETRELACDELVTERLVDAPAYARSLLTIADSIMHFRRPAYTLGIFDADILEERIMKLIAGKPRLSKRTGIALLAVTSLVLVFSSAFAVAFSLKVEQSAKNAKSMVGNWELFLTEDGQDPKGSLLEFPVGLELRLDGDKLAGKASFPKILATDEGPKRVGTSEASLVNLVYTGHLLSFKIEGKDKGDFVEMQLQPAGDKFEGRWKILRSAEAGSVKMQREQTGKSALIEKIIGEWTVSLSAGDGAETKGEPPALIVKTDGNQLTAKTVFNVGGERKEWKLIDPKFDGETFIFKVDNGEELLEAKLKWVDDHFEGPWKASQSGGSGTMKLTRKKS
jgi:beta-lactamase regulating signal transducer with metallopeptidase domain